MHTLYCEHWVDQLIRSPQDKIQNRLAQEIQTPGFIVKLIEAYEAGKMSTAQLESNARVLILGGSETTATLLSGLIPPVCPLDPPTYKCSQLQPDRRNLLPVDKPFCLG
jgi:hypothetical protein